MRLASANSLALGLRPVFVSCSWVRRGWLRASFPTERLPGGGGRVVSRPQHVTHNLNGTQARIAPSATIEMMTIITRQIVPAKTNTAPGESSRRRLSRAAYTIQGSGHNNSHVW